MQYETAFLFSLFLTVSIETIVLLILAKYMKLQTRKKELIFAGIIASSLTLPYLWFVLPIFLKNYILHMIVGEISVTVVESIIYYFVLKTNLKNVLIISFVCNLVSFLFGLIVF